MDRMNERSEVSGRHWRLASCYKSGAAEKLVDFDDHLDDLTQDWRNPHLDDVIAKA